MDLEIIKAVAPVGATLVGLAGLYLAWRNQREAQLRKADVLKWAFDVIAAFQLLSLKLDAACQSQVGDTEQIAEALGDLRLQFSTLSERGRMFFRNAESPHGREKENAYRGLRPEILDQLIIAFQVAGEFQAASPQARWRLRHLAISASQRFVSLAQLEVGRATVASAKAGAAGDGIILSRLVASITDNDLEKSRNRFRAR